MLGTRASDKMRQAAKGHLQRTASLFASSLGETEEDGQGLTFDAPAPFSSLRFELHHAPKFLGGILAMQCTATLPAQEFLSSPLTLQYRGALLKGAAYFSNGSRKEAIGPLADRLHKDEALMALLGRIDLEAMTLTPDAEGLRCTMRPVGGSYVWSLIPPVKYAVPLPPEQATAMAQALTGLGRHLHSLAKQPGSAAT